MIMVAAVTVKIVGVHARQEVAGSKPQSFIEKTTMN